MVRTEQDSEKRSGRLVGAAKISKGLADRCRLQWKNLEHTGPAEKEKVASVPLREQLGSMSESLLPKETEPSVQRTRS